MADAVITRDGPVAVPLSYTVPTGTEIVPRVVTADFDGSAAAGPFEPTLEVLSPSGFVVARCPLLTVIAAGGSASVSWFPGAEVEPAAAAVVPGVTDETLFVPASSSTGTLSSIVLAAGVTYTLIVEGTYTEVNHALDVGTPDADAMFPTSTAGRVSTQVGIDAETLYAGYSILNPVLGHAIVFKVSLDGGATYNHIEPVGGPFAIPNAGHLYRYTVVGQGHVAGFLISDTVYTDNYGELKVTIQAPSGTGTGSGAGSLVPPSAAANNGQVVAIIGGVPTLTAVDGGSA